MIIAENLPRGQTPLAPSLEGADNRPAPSLGETFGAGFALENTVTAAIDMMTRPAFQPDPEFEPLSLIEGTKYEQFYLDNFIGAQSQDEARWIMGRIDEEERNREIIARSGGWGVLANMAAGVADPTVFIPLGGWLAATGRASRIAVRAGEGAAVTGAAVAGQEAVLHAAQETRTGEESAWNIAFATLIGGAFGAAIGGLSRRGNLLDLADRYRREAPGSVADEQRIWTGAGGATSAGAAATAATRGEAQLAGALGAERLFGEQDPLIRTTTSASRETRLAAFDLAETPLTRTDSGDFVVASEGGPAEALMREARGPLADALNTLDDLYSRYFFGRATRLAAARGTFAVMLGRGGGKMTYSDFKEEIFDAWLAGDRHAIPEVAEAAKYLRSRVLTPLADQAADARVPGFKRDMKPQSGDAAYLPRAYDRARITAGRPGFKDLLTLGLNRAKAKAVKLAESWRRRTRARLEQEVADLELSGEARATTLFQLEDELNALRAAGRRFAPIDEALSDLRTRARAGDATARAAVRTEVQNAGQDYADFVTRRNLLRSRIRRVRGSVEGRQDQVEALRQKIADTEAANVDRLWRMHEAIAKLQSEMSGMSDDVLRSELADLRTKFAKVMERSHAAHDRLATATTKAAETTEPGAPTPKLDAAEDKFARAEFARINEMDRLAERISDTEEIDPALATTELRMLIERRISQAAQVVEDEGRRILAMTERLRAADPDLVRKRVAALRTRLAEVENRAGSQLAEMSADEISATVDEIIDTILGNAPSRFLLPSDLVSGPRGALKERTLNFLSTKELRPWLLRDAEKLVRRYSGTMAADVALMKKFGSTDLAEQLRKINDDYNRMLDGAETPKERQRLAKARATDLRDIAAMRDRLRGTYARTDTDSLAYRAGVMAKNVNYLRLLGGMTLSAFPDVARPVMVHGLMRSFGTAFTAFTGGLSRIKLAGNELKLAGTALDMALDTRAMAIADISDDMIGHSRLEKTVEAATRKFGVVSLMAPWNTAMKQWVGAVAMTRMLQAIENLAAGRTVPRKEIALLADNFIDRSTAGIIAEQFAKHGTKDRGVWLPNTADWDEGAQRAASIFRRGLARDVDRTIVMPGQDKPLWLSRPMGSVIGQFKTFAVASVQRTLLSGLQQRDMAALNGVVLTMGLGAMVYWMKARLGGYDVSDNPRQWAVEGFDRSGLPGWLMDINNFSEKITAGRLGLSALTGETVSRYASRNALGSAMGPTFDALGTALQVAGAPWKEGGVTGTDTHAVRKLLPLQNLFYIRWLFDHAEKGANAAAGIPQRRTSLKVR